MKPANKSTLKSKPISDHLCGSLSGTSRRLVKVTLPVPSLMSQLAVYQTMVLVKVKPDNILVPNVAPNNNPSTGSGA